MGEGLKRAFKATKATRKSEREHEWFVHTSQMGQSVTCCRVCGIVKRSPERIMRDGPNKPCPGFVRVELRDTKPPT